jgi:malate dehydrogenase
MSASSAALDHVRSFLQATAADDWYSAAVASDGSYGIDEGLIFSFPLVSDGKGRYQIVQGLPWSDSAQSRIQVTLNELRDEKETVADLLP